MLLLGAQRVPGTREIKRRERLAAGAGASVGRSDRIDLGQLGVGRHDAHLLLPGQRLLTNRLIALVELALELLDPLLGRMVWCVTGTRRVVQEERLLGSDRLRVADELDGLVGQILGQVVPVLGLARLIDGVVVVDEIGIPLAGLGAEEAIPALEPAAARPVSPRGCEVHLILRTEMPLANHVRVPAPLAQNLGKGAVLGRDRAAGVGKADRRLGDARHAVAGVVSPRQKTRSGG